ncbi:MAG: YbhN family protein [Myxococcota bacterium]
MTTPETPDPEKPPRGGTRRILFNLLKAAITFGAFYLLLTHKVPQEDGTRISALQMIIDHLPEIDARTFWTFVFAATGVKIIGIISSMTRWHVLLIAQGIRFPFIHIVGSFLIGRFLGTFLPSTLGLDGYKLYDAARFSKRTVEATAATIIEKVLGFVGIFLTFLVALPFGASLFAPHTGKIAAGTIPVCIAIVGAFFLLMTNPRPIQRAVEAIPLPGAGREKLRGFISRTSTAAAAFRHRGGTLALATVLSFLVHFTTAAMYFFTALAVGAAHAEFWQVTLASTVQILATVLSPFTIAGEGVREIVQWLLLAKKIGVSESILSAALGFWAAEALTLLGGIVWWVRGSDYKPRYCVLKDPDTAA